MHSSLRTLGAILVAAAPLFLACGGDGPTGDRTAPTVSATTPANGATNVDRTVTVTATFSERLDPSTVNATTFTLTPAAGAAVQGTITLNASGTVATFAPNQNLAFETTYTARLTTGIEDVAGNRLAAAHSWSFTTLGNPAPTVTAVTPANGASDVAATTSITATFSEPVANVSTASFTVTPAGGSPIDGTIGQNQDQTVFTFQPGEALLFGTTYTVRITTGVTDLFGKPLAQEFTSTFTTIENDPPSANAGPAQDVARGATVTLSGSATDPDGDPIATYRWTQVFGPDVTGGAGFLEGQSPSFTAPAAVSSLRFELRVTDDRGAGSQASLVQINVMEDPANAFFVNGVLGDDNNPGTRSAPLKTIIIAVARAASAGNGGDVYVANGTYNEGVNLSTGVSLYGGFFSGTWLRDPDAAPVTILGPTNMIGLSGFNVSDVVVDGFGIRTPDEFIAVGQSAYGVYLSGVQNVTISSNTIFAGDAGPGGGGQFGFAGAPGLRGTNGTDAVCPAPGTGGAGGLPETPNAGSQLGPAGGRGGDGGGPGASGQAGVAGGAGGATTTPGTAGQAGGALGGIGGTGGDGQRGADGTDGTGASDAIALGINGFVPAGGTDGTSGTSGSSGGGGGGGAGSATGAGGGGGGGGAGGGGGNFGQGGTGGGGSFGILIMSSTNVTIANNEIRTSDGGIGGPGGPGGNGGIYGAPGVGGTGCEGGGAGGTGGHGGAGGNGGDGGGGAGGPSVGILMDAASTVQIAPTNVFMIGTPGQGGFSPGGLGALGTGGQAADVIVVP